jgi:hypothetical protein
MNSAVRRPPLVPRVDRAAPLQFLRTGYEADDWIAVFLKRYDTGEAVQRVAPVTLVPATERAGLAAADERLSFQCSSA